jgi:hypothetical protein
MYRYTKIGRPLSGPWLLSAWKGHVVAEKSKYADSKSSAYLRTWYVAENKEVPDRLIGVTSGT